MTDIKLSLVTIVFLSGFLINQNITLSQEVDRASIIEKNHSKMWRLAKEAKRTGNNYLALEYFEAIYAEDSTDINLSLDLAELYRNTHNYVRAEIFYSIIIKSKLIEKYPDAYFFLAQAQKNNGKYNEAKSNLLLFKKKLGNARDPRLKKLYKSELEGCEMVLAHDKDSNTLFVHNVGTNINHPHIDFSPIPVGDDRLIYGSYPDDDERIFLLNDSSEFDTQKRSLYEAQKINGEWQSKGELEGPFNDPEMDIANGCFSLDSSRFYFSKCTTNWQYKVVCSIYETKKINGKWSQPELLNELINMPDYTSTHPTIGRESRKNNEVLYFVSDREGGKGGRDIWFAEFDPRKKSFKKARNAGSKINTVGDEMTPFYDLPTKTLFYSTDGKANLGGLDIYSAKGETSKWEPAQHLGFEINSSADDLDYVIKSSNRGGFFVSNRAGGQSLYHSTCCDDIYEFEFSKYIDIQIVAVVFDNEQNKLQDGLKLNLYLVAESGKLLIQNVESLDDLKQFKLRPNQNYELEVKKDGYFPGNINISTNGVVESVQLKKDVTLEKYPQEPILIPNINFDFDSPNITKQSKAILDTTLLVLFQKHSTIQIEISAHTDNKGSDSYNLTLSQKRAESIVKYLNSKGVPLNQMIAIGYGETKPIAPNTNQNGSDNPTGREKNRRVEFTILGEIDPDLDESEVVETFEEKEDEDTE